ncbi:hypothetical protein ACJ73_03316 [Blastomyces percursus]|uniref:RRM domain-containing protein n=1 Tax=Blastomyces percursus TaxID=1658174 RepID=A0A1J9Q949_9EURO|nr:hypothetical protein ACJ73_03316 [Blastomyces percursus]
MFIGGLNWETTDQSLKDYFSQFGEVQECTVMRDGATGRSRGFGFLTFKDPKTVNTVMVKEHYLDGKIVRTAHGHWPAPTPTRCAVRDDSRLEVDIYMRTYKLTRQNKQIDPKRAIPRDEQERTSKIFVGGVSQEATEQDFKQFFMQFGRVVDATLMIDKDSGRPRGFGFVTFDSEAAVEATLSGPLEILGKPIEVKKAQPRGNMRDDDDRGRGSRRGMRDQQDRYGRDSDRSTGQENSQQQNTQSQGGLTSGMSPQMMAQYWQRMQQYFALMQQQMAAAAAQGQPAGNAMGMAGMNPAMLQQMSTMGGMGGGTPQGAMSPGSQVPGAQGMQGMMNPAMMQQMQHMQQIQNQGQGPVPGGPGFGAGGMGGQMNNAMAAGPGPGPSMGGNMGGGGVGGGVGGPPPGGMGGGGGPTMGMGGPGGSFSGPRGGPGYNAQEQIAFEQQKYEQQQARRAIESSRGFAPYQQGGPTSWEGMYDDVPQPNIPSGPQSGGCLGRGGGGGMGRGMSPSHGMPPQHGGARPSPSSNKSITPQPQSAPPANAPTGPRNAGKPGANYRGGGRGAHRGFHPYART